jgi:hypothetical protein
MEDSTRSFITLSRRIRSALMVFCALVLFLAGLLLLFAPASAQDSRSRIRTPDFPDAANRWIMGAHSHEPGFSPETHRVPFRARDRFGEAIT